MEILITVFLVYVSNQPAVVLGEKQTSEIELIRDRDPEACCAYKRVCVGECVQVNVMVRVKLSVYR